MVSTDDISDNLSYYAQWAFGLLFILTGFGFFAESIISGIVTVGLGLFLVPRVREAILENFEFELPKYALPIIVVIGMAVSGAFLPSDTTSSPADTSPSNEIQQPVQNESDNSDSFKVSEVEILSSSVSPKEGSTPLNVTGTLRIENVGNASTEYTVDFNSDGVYMSGKTKPIGAGEERTIQVSYVFDSPGQREVSLAGYDARKSGEITTYKTEQVTVSVPEPEPINLSGTGDTSTDQFDLEPGLSIYEMSHTGSSNFQVSLLNEQGEQEELLANRIGYFEGSNAYGGLGGEHLLDVNADGDWEITVRQPRPTSAQQLPVTLSGDSRKATNFFSSDGGLTTFQMEHNGDGNFQVTLLNKNGMRQELLANEIGQYEGSTATGLEEGIYLLDVNANGDWSITAE